MKYILGLDVSTSCTGWCIIHYNENIHQITTCYSGYIKLNSIDKTYDKALEVKNILTDLAKNHNANITDIIIEENLESFKTGLSSAHTLVTLARFNGIVSYISEDIFKLSPRFINVNEARKSLGLKIITQKKGGKPTKEQVFDWVNKDISHKNLSIKWPVEQPTRGKNKGETIISKCAYDMADAYVIALSSLYIPI